MTHSMTSKDIALNNLSLHPSNVRAKSPETYETENIAHLVASIAALGLLNPLIVQKTESGYGVLAGGRRYYSLLALSKDKSQESYTSKMQIECRVVPDDCDITTAISLAENITQEGMQPIDEFEAFARMMQSDDQSVETLSSRSRCAAGGVSSAPKN